jgi:ubiquinone/menaquinone biosynthesis C-methylase UbiE
MLKIEKRSISKTKLLNRIKFNSSLQKNSFIDWQKKIYNLILKDKFSKKEVNILDVGAGTGLQTEIFTRKFKNSQIICIDKSKSSLSYLKKKYKKNNIKTQTMDFDKIKNFFFKKKLPIIKFDIIHSSYALYYSKNPKELLSELYRLLNYRGIFIVAAPDKPHEMLDFVNKFGKVPNKVLKTILFSKKICFPFFKSKSNKVGIFSKINYIKFKKCNDFLKFWKNTTYYNVKYLKKIQKELLKKKSLNFKKTASIIYLQKM